MELFGIQIMSPVLLWLLIGIAFFLVEIMAPSFFMLFFGMGAWLTAFLLLFFDLSFAVQLAVFLVSSLLFLALLRRILKRVFEGHTSGVNAGGIDIDDFIGKTASVIEAIEPPERGRVSFRGSQWYASSETAIPIDTTVEIIEKQNQTLVVKPK